MDDANNYAVIGLTHYNEMRDRLASLEYENNALRVALEETRQEVQDRITVEDKTP